MYTFRKLPIIKPKIKATVEIKDGGNKSTISSIRALSISSAFVAYNISIAKMCV